MSASGTMSLKQSRAPVDDVDVDMQEIVLPSKYDAYYEPDIDEETQLPITRLPYDEGPVPNDDPDWLKHGRHLDLSIDRANSTGVVYLSGNGPSKTRKTSKALVKASSEVFPFQLEPLVDNSEEKQTFLNGLYDDFEPLLKNRAYKTYSDDDMEIGVVNVIETERERKTETLRILATSMIERTKQLVSAKIDQESTDTIVFSYEEALNMLNLLNALYFAKEDERIVLLQMWVNRADLQPTDSLVSAAMEGGQPYKNIAFWSGYLQKLVMRGYFEQAVSSIEESGYKAWQLTDVNTYNLANLVIDLLSSYDSVAFSYDSKAFLHWKAEAVNLRESSAALSYENAEISIALKEVVSCLSGYSQTIRQCTTSWYECFLAHYMYQLPAADQVQKYLKVSVDAFPVDAVCSWESGCLDLFDAKYLRVVTALESLDKSMATYAAVLMDAAGLLKQYSEVSDTVSVDTAIDKMIQDLALSYLTEKPMFATGTGILVTTGDPGARQILSEMLPTYQVENNDDFEWCLSICAKLKLPQTAVSIYNIQGEELLNLGYEYESLECFSEAGNPGKVVETMWKLFENLLLGGEYQDETLNGKIDHNEFEDSPILRQALAPYALLREVIQSIGKNEPPFDQLISLLQFKYLPAYYKPALLVKLLSYFNTGTFTLGQLIEIIKILDAYEVQISNDPETVGKTERIYSAAAKNNATAKDLPATAHQLIFKVRKAISFEISFKFLYET